MAWRAKFNGRCAKCSGEISKGDLISWARRGERRVYHYPGCSTVHEAVTAASVETPAPTPTPVETPRVESTPATTPAGEPNPLAAAIALAVAPYLQGAAKSEELAALEGVVQDFMAEIEGKLADAAKQEPSSVELVLRLQRPDGTETKLKGAHESMPKLLALLALNQHVYLYGPPGSGKSTAAKQAADGLGRSYAYIALNPQTPESRLLGFIDAHGVYRETPFFKSYTEGGVFCIDEMDNAHPALLAMLNGMLENGLGAFPCGVRERHADFVLVATGNTAGRGADPAFPERRAFDAATAERFIYLAWEYDTGLERKLTLAACDKAAPWLAWVRQVRAYAKQERLRNVIASPRASVRGAMLLAATDWPVQTIADAVLLKGLGTDIANAILAAAPLPVEIRD